MTCKGSDHMAVIAALTQKYDIGAETHLVSGVRF